MASLTKYNEKEQIHAQFLFEVELKKVLIFLLL